ncbi:hypothetical protein BDV29DRAFT_184587 [Aspergillus leporis]|jgi:hypothetical protein|uniref:Uncharacterized protein n=1 Tax=Aspergillus leporis TaxID=41062 RepID=A0A5N5WM86_9EURO|nr:hypothetical protein BDV29DRAFT_184587 [Aspergillus leporis]
MERSEILVHISAPCGVSDDARHRAQVEAILGFQSASRQIIALDTDDSDHDDTTSLATSDLPSNSISLRGPATPTNDTTNHPAIIIYNKTLASEKYQQPNDQPCSHSPKDSLDSPVSVIPDSQPGRLSSETGNLQDADHQLSTVRNRNVPPSLEVPPAKRYQATSPSPKGSSKKPRHSQRSTDEANPAQTGNSTEKSTPSSSAIGISFPVPSEIKPRLPLISNDQFKTHITPTLEMLATRLRGRTYKPLEQTRELDKLERGYWFLRINVIQAETHESTVSILGTEGASNWDISLFSRFWSFLSEFIKEGRAGWGVWCILEDAPDAQLPCDPQGSKLREMNIRPLTLKIYAWGETASHVYVLLFLASERRVRKMSAQWRDGRDDVVIQMP